MKRYRPRRERGAVLIAALVCLSIIVGLLGHMLVGAVRVQRQLHRERDRCQCELLLQAGLQRGVQQLAKNPAYRGETWQAKISELPAASEGQVVIEIVEETADRHAELRASAEFPLGSPLSVRRSNSISIQLSSQNQE